MEESPKKTDAELAPRDSVALALALGEERGLRAATDAQVEQLRRQIDEIRLGATRPRADTLSEIEGAPAVSESIRVIKATVAKQPSASENRLLTLAILVVILATEVLRHIH